MTLSTARRSAFGAILVLMSTLVLTSCVSPHDNAGADQQIVVSCPAKPIASTTAIDVTGSFQSEAINAANLEAIAAEVRRTVLCGGHLRVFAFASSTGATVMIFDADLLVDAPTEKARARKADKLADETMATITEQYELALREITGNGSDPLSMLTLLQQSNALNPDHTLVNQLITDGVITVGVDPTVAPNAEAARDLADQQLVPSLAGAELSIVGIGKQSTGELPSSVIANLTAFWEKVCLNTGAAKCHVSIDGR